MNHIKSYNEYVKYNIEDYFLIQYKTVVDEIEYNISFKKDIYDSYQRDYTVMGEKKYPIVNKNPYNIVSEIALITEQFLKEYDVDALIIQHINSKSDTTAPNKRAKLNYRYLSKIKGYFLYYFIDDNPNYLENTYLIMCKPGIEPLKYISKILIDPIEIFIK